MSLMLHLRGEGAVWSKVLHETRCGFSSVLMALQVHQVVELSGMLKLKQQAFDSEENICSIISSYSPIITLVFHA